MPTEMQARTLWPVQTRREAFEAGQARYFTGKPCKHGHWEQRAVASGICVGCNRAYAAKYRGGVGRDGQATFEVSCHPADVEGIKAHVAAVNAARDASAPAFDVAAVHARIYPGVTLQPGAPTMTPRTRPE